MAVQSGKIRLYRSETDKVIGGVAGGFGEVFDIDPTILRIVLLVLFFFGGSGLLLYLICWLVIPTKSKGKGGSNETIRDNVAEMKGTAREMSRSRSWFGIALLALGVYFLLHNFGVLPYFDIAKFWPLILIAVAYVMLTRK